MSTKFASPVMRDSLLTFRRPLLRDTFYPAGNVLNNVLLGARTTLGLHDNYEAAQALLVVQRPQLDGTVVDEIGGHSAGALGGKASTFSGAETIPLGVATPANTIMSSGVWVKSSTTASRYAYGNYRDDGFLLGVNSGGVFRVVLRDSAGDYKAYNSSIGVCDGEWHFVFFTWAAGVLRLFVDGVEDTAVDKEVDTIITTVGVGDSGWHRVSGYATAPTVPWVGQIQYPMRWDGYELTDHEIAMLADSMTLPSTEPDFLGYLIGDKCHDLSGNLAMVTGTATITEYSDVGVPVAPFDLDSAGRDVVGTFDGSNDYVSITDSGVVPVEFQGLSDDIIIEAYINADEFGTADTGVWRSSNTIVEMRVEAADSTVKIPFSFGVNGGLLTIGGTSNYTTDDYKGEGGTTLVANTTYKVKAVISGDTYELFVNDILDGSGSTTPATGDRSVGTATSNFTIGCRSFDIGTPGNFFKGRIWNLTISDSSGVIGKWNHDDGSGLTVADSSGNGNDGTISGATSDQFWGTIIPVNLDGSSAVGRSSPTYSGRAKKDGQLTKGSAVELAGAETGSVVGDDSDFALTGDMTFSIWLKADTISSFRNIVSFGAGGETEAANVLWRLYMNAGGLIYIHEEGAGINESVDFAESISIGVATHIAFVRDDTAKTVKLYINGVFSETFTYTTSATGGTSSTLTLGSFDGGSYFDGKLWDARVYDATKTDAEVTAIYNREIDTTDAVEIWPMCERAGLVSYGVVNGHDLEWTATLTHSSAGNDVFHWPEAKGCSSVPIFVDGVELIGSVVDYDGLKTAVVELDFVPKDLIGAKVLFTNSSVGPFRIDQDQNSIRIFHRTSTEAVTFATASIGLIAGELYKIRVVITEDESNPTTASSALVYNRETGEYLGGQSNKNIALSYIATNTGPQQIGSYTNALNSFNNDLYRVRHVAGGVEQLLWTSDNYLVNQTDDSAMTETGGTLEQKLIPALADGSGNDVNGYPLTNPAAAKIRNTGVEVDFDPDGIYQWTDNLWQGMTGDGVGYLTLTNEITLSGAFEISFRAYSDDFNQSGIVLGDSSATSKIGFLTAAGGVVFVRVVDGSDGDSTIGYPAAGEHVFVLTRNSSDIVTLSIDDTDYTLFSGAAQTGDMVLGQIFADSILQIFAGKLRNLKIIDDGTTVLDMSGKNLLDLSGQANHASITAAGITFDKQTLDDHAFGDVEEIPASIDQATSGEEKKMIHFTI